MKEKCQHLRVDGWHVPTQEAREIVRSAATGYTWRDQLRAEMTGEVSRWMWPGLLALLTVGVLLHDWLLIVGAGAAMLFFAYQAINLVRTLGAGSVITARCDEVHEVEGGASGAAPVFAAWVRVRDAECEIVLHCPECVAALSAGTPLELMVVMDADDPDNHWLAGFRAV